MSLESVVRDVEFDGLPVALQVQELAKRVSKLEQKGETTMVEPVIRPDGTVLDTAGMTGTGVGPAGSGGSPFPQGTGPGIPPASKEQAEAIQTSVDKLQVSVDELLVLARTGIK